MVDTELPATTQPPEMGAPESAVSLTDFCRDLSANDKRVELIAGFHYDEVRAGKIVDTASAYRDRYAAFADKPVK